MMIRCFPTSSPSRRKILQQTIGLTTGLVVGRSAQALATPNNGVNDVPEKVQTREDDPLMPEILYLIKIRAPEDNVFQAVSTVEGIRNWWTRDAVFDSRIGSAGEFGFYGHRMVIHVNVAEVSPPRHMAWDVISSTGGAFDGTSIAFDLKEGEGVTALSFVHRGFKAAGNNIPSATTRWGFYLFSLKRFLETGTGTPNPDDTELIR